MLSLLADKSIMLRSPRAAVLQRSRRAVVDVWTLAAVLLARVSALLAQALQLAALLLAQLLVHTCQAAWASLPLRTLRKKVVFEVVVLVLGPGGNGLLLALLWPGWLVLGAVVWAVRAWAG